MSMEVSRVFGEAHNSEFLSMQQRSAQQALQSGRSAAQRSIPAAAADLDSVLGDLLSVTQIFNHRLQFTVNQDLDQVVVKVIDKTTDRVIKEIPPAELQRVHSRIREAIGLFVDEQI